MVPIFLAHALGHAHGQLGRNIHHQPHGGRGQIAAVEADLREIRTVDHAVFAKILRLGGEVQAGQVLALGERAVFDALRIGHEGGQPREIERLLANLHEMLAKVQIAQRTRAVEGIVADLAHTVDEYHIVQVAAEHELIAASALKGRVADERLQLLAVGEHHVRQLFDRFGQHQRAQMHPLGAVSLHGGIGVVMAGIKGVVVCKAHNGHAVDLARHDNVHVGSDIGGDQAGSRIELEVLGGSRLEGHLHEFARFALAQHGIVPRALECLVPRGQLLGARVGGQAQLGARALDGGKWEAAGGGNDHLRQLCVRKGSLAHGSGRAQARALQRGTFKRARADGGDLRQVDARQRGVGKRARADGDYVLHFSGLQRRIRKSALADFGHARAQREHSHAAALKHMRRDRAGFYGHVAQSGQICKHTCGDDRRVALDHQLFQPCQAVQRAFADGGQRVGQRQRFQLRAVCERPRTDGGHGVEQVNLFQGAVHEGLRADGGELVVMSDGEVFDGLTVLEHAVAQADHRLLRDGEMGVNARLRAGVFGQHAVFVLIRALLRRLGGRVLRTPDAAGKPQRLHIGLPLLHLLTAAVRVQVDVVQIIAACEDVLAQRGRGRACQNDVLDVVIALERVRAD